MFEFYEGFVLGAGGIIIVWMLWIIVKLRIRQISKEAQEEELDENDR